MTRDFEASLNVRAIAVLMVLSMAGGVVGIVVEAFSLPVVLGFIAASLFGVGVAGSAIAAFVASRTTGAGFGRSLLAGLRFAGRWILELAP
jgi:hypothetical protein